MLSAYPWRFLLRSHGFETRLKLRQRAPIFARNDLHEMLERVGPVGEQCGGFGAAGRELMPLEQDAQPFGVVAERMAHAGVVDARRFLRRRALSPGRAGRSDAFERHALEIALALKRGFGVVDVRDAAGHARGEVAADWAEHADDAAGHIFAAMVAGALDYCDRAGVAYCKAFAGHALEIGLARDGPVKHGVADDDVARWVAVRALGLANEHAPARQTLADIVIAVAGQLERDAMREERCEALARRAVQPDNDAVLRQAFVP